jgi:catechol 2,3-dioxygenase
MKLGHVHLKVSDLAAAERFYCDVLGIQVQERTGHTFVFLSYGVAHHDLALQEVPGVKRSASDQVPGLYHCAFEVHSTDELLAAVTKLKENGINYSLVDHGISWAAYTEDPSGNGVEIYLDRRGAPGGTHHWGGVSRHLSEYEIKSA